SQSHSRLGSLGAPSVLRARGAVRESPLDQVGPCSPHSRRRRESAPAGRRRTWQATEGDTPVPRERYQHGCAQAQIKIESSKALNRDFRYGPISAPVTASTDQTVLSVSSFKARFTLPNRLMAVLLAKPGACATPYFSSWSSDRAMQRHRHGVAPAAGASALCPVRQITSGATRVARCPRGSAGTGTASSGSRRAAG